MVSRKVVDGANKMNETVTLGLRDQTRHSLPPRDRVKGRPSILSFHVTQRAESRFFSAITYDSNPYLAAMLLLHNLVFVGFECFSVFFFLFYIAFLPLANEVHALRSLIHNTQTMLWRNFIISKWTVVT